MKFLISIAFLINNAVAFGQIITGNFAIKNVSTGMLLRVKDAQSADGTPLVAYYPENWKCMTWRFISQKENTYQLQNLLTRKTFQPAGDANSESFLEEKQLLSGSSAQQYEFILVKNDTYRIRQKDTELYLTLDSEKAVVNTTIKLAKKKDSTAQLWTIYKQEPTM